MPSTILCSVASLLPLKQYKQPALPDKPTFINISPIPGFSLSPTSPASPPSSSRASLSGTETLFSSHRGGDKGSYASHDDSNYDSDATLDLEDPTSPIAASFLKDALPLRRMSRGYERKVLHSLSHSKGEAVAYACACSRGDGCKGGRRAGHMCRAYVKRWSEEDVDYDADVEESSYFVSIGYDDEGGVNELDRPRSVSAFGSSDGDLLGTALIRSHTADIAYSPLSSNEASCECDTVPSKSVRNSSGSLPGYAESPL